MKAGNSSDKHICIYCNNSIPSLTYKLQQHTSSSLWLKYGQCCAACISKGNIEAANELEVSSNVMKPSNNKSLVKKGNHRTNILLALSRVSGLEEMSRTRVLIKANRIIFTGKIIFASGITAGFIFIYYELFVLSLIFLRIFPVCFLPV